jgi:pimeloyl-ACP methyl ester carboxylesterase
VHERAVVFLHGVFGGPSDFEPVESLLDEDVRCLCPELPVSGRPAAPGMADLVQYVDDVLEDKGLGEAVFIGHSFGSSLALAYAHRHPQRVRGIVLSGLVALDLDGLEAPPGMPLLLLASHGSPDDAFGRAAARRLRGSRLLFVIDGDDAPLLTRPSLFAFHVRAFLNDVFPPRLLGEEDALALATR